MTPVRKALVVLLALVFLGAFSLGMARDAAAAQNAPSWSTGNQWVYATKVGNTPATITMVVRSQTSLAIGSSTYSVWDLNVTTSASTSSGQFSVWSDDWFTVDGLRLAKSSNNVFGPSTTTYDPPLTQYRFPLSPSQTWTVHTNATTVNALGTNTVYQTDTFLVTAEQTVTVPAGTFTTEVVRTPASGGTYTLRYYSEQAGNAVRTENYVAGTLTLSQNLTSYNYSPGLFGIPNIIWIIGLVIAFIVVVAAVMYMRRRPRVPRPMYLQQPYQPPAPPPPQQPPQ